MAQRRRVLTSVTMCGFVLLLAYAGGCKSEEEPPPPRRVPPPPGWTQPPASAAPARPMPSRAPMPASPPRAVSLYERLGGEKGTAAVVDDLVTRALADPTVNFARSGVAGHEWAQNQANVARVKQSIVQFLCMATGGPQSYQGRPIRQVHEGMRITDAEFDALAADLRASMQKLNVPQREQNELLAIVETTRADVVGR